jgi:ClpP class serine protease
MLLCSLSKGALKKRRVPVYTFVEDICTGGAHVILSCGNKVYANEYSYIGDFGFNLGVLNYSELFEKNEAEYTWVHPFEQDPGRLNPFRKIRKDDLEWGKNFVEGKASENKRIIMRNRKRQFDQLKVSEDTLDKELFSKPYVNPKKAKELG